MQRVAVDFGKATFSHSTANLELRAQATASLKTSCPHLSQQPRVNAAALLLEDLWVRLRRPLRLSFALTGPSHIACDFQHVCESNEGLLSSLSAAAFWSQLRFEVVDATCDQASDQDAEADACARIEIHLDRIRTRNSDGLYDGSDAMEHDINDINCPSSMSMATLTEVWLQLDFEPSDQYERKPSRARQAALVATVDAALRDLLCQTRPRLMAGMQRELPFSSNLQDVFPAVFCPGRSKAMSDRLRLVSSIFQSIIKCRRKSKKLDTGYIGSSLAEASEEASCREDTYHHQERLDNSLVMGLIHNTGNAKSAKALKPLTANKARGNASLHLSELPGIADDLESFCSPNRGANASSMNLFFEDHNESKRDSEGCQYARSPTTEPEDVDEVAAEVAAMIRSSPAFEDLTDTVPSSEPLPADCELGDPLVGRSRSEVFFTLSPLTSFTDQQPILKLEDDASMLREPFALAEEAEAGFSSNSSTSSDVIGEHDRLTQSWTRHSPPDDCSIRTAPLQIDKSNLGFIDDLFAADSHHTPRTSLTTELSSIVANLATFDDDSSVCSSSDLELECSSQELQVAMDNSINEDLTLAELLGDSKFSPEMWVRRRSTVMHSLPSTYVSSPPTRTLGSGWSLRSLPREIKGGTALPITTHTHDARQHPVIEEDSRPIFSKRSSTSSSASTPQSPTEAKIHRRDSLLKRWSRSSKASSDHEMLDLDLSQIDKRSVEVKRRKTIEDYNMRDADHDDEDEDDMLFA